jgi:CheY-like chemotaxis protein
MGILFDLSMPKLDGAAAASALKKIAPKVPIILFTLYDDATDALARALHVEMVVAKPDGITNLVDSVEQLLDAKAKREEDRVLLD